MIAKVQIRPKPKVYKILVISKNESCEISLHEKVVSSQNLIFGEKSGSKVGQIWVKNWVKFGSKSGSRGGI